MIEKENQGVFDNPLEIDSLFESVSETQDLNIETEKLDLFSEEVKEEVKEKQIPNLFNEDSDKETVVNKSGNSSLGEAIQLLIKSNDEFLVYEGDDEKRMIQSTDRKILDVNRQSEIDKEIQVLEGK